MQHADTQGKDMTAPIVANVRVLLGCVHLLALLLILRVRIESEIRLAQLGRAYDRYAEGQATAACAMWGIER